MAAGVKPKEPKKAQNFYLRADFGVVAGGFLAKGFGPDGE